MKRNFLLYAMLLLVISISGCKKEPGGIRIRFINTSGTEIQQAVADDMLLGNIANGASTGYIRFEKFGTDTGLPDCKFNGIQNGIQTGSTSIFYWCGTEKSALKEGEYDIEISIRQYSNVPYFRLQFR